MPIQRPQPGSPEKISVSQWVRVQEFVEESERDSSTGVSDPSIDGDLGDNVIVVKNTTSTAVDRLQILGVSGVLITPTNNLAGFKNGSGVTGTTPTTAAHKGKFVITMDPIAPGKYGRAWASGCGICKISMTDATHAFAEVKNGDTTMLASAASGTARIIWVESGTGTKWALVAFGGAGGGVAPGTVKYHVYQMLTNSTAGWDYVRAHGG